ncbi:hypothetical protein D3C81_1156800 [compost metagenome]
MLVLERFEQQWPGKCLDVLKGRHGSIKIVLGDNAGLHAVGQRLALCRRRVEVPRWQRSRNGFERFAPLRRSAGQPRRDRLFEKIAVQALRCIERCRLAVSGSSSERRSLRRLWVGRDSDHDHS